GVTGALRASDEDGLEMLCQLRVAQARRAGQQEESIRSLYQLRVAQDGWRGAQKRNLYKESSFSDLAEFFLARA
ncbi:hypothetical protein A2U01_0100889, partial [Trifolium medium]|nr:hypothetical protein [Trifolium medium]